MKRFLGIMSLALALASPVGGASAAVVQFWMCANGPVDIAVFNIPGEGPSGPTAQAFGVPRNTVWGGACVTASCVFEITYSPEPDGRTFGKVSYLQGYTGRICVPAGTKDIVNDGCLC